MPTTELIESWWPAVVGFAIMAAAINALMTAYKKSVKDTAFAGSSWYKRTLPFLPSLMGAVSAPFVGPTLTPVEFSVLIHIGAGILQGSLGVHFYTIWEHAIQRADDRIQEVIANPSPDEDDTLNK